MSPLLYTRRNPGRTVPIMLVILLSVVLVASVVTIVRSISLTVYTLYGYNRYTTGLTPRNALSVDEQDVARIQKLPQLGVLAPTHSYQTLLRTIFGRLYFPIFGLSASARDLFMRRCGIHLQAGRLPAEGAPEVAVSAEVARNLHVRIGQVILKPDSEDSYAPVPMKLVGVLIGPVWLGLTSKAFVDLNSPFTWQGYLAFAKTPGQQRQLDAAMERVVDKSKARVWRYSYLLRETQDSLANLYLMLDIVVTIVVGVITFVCGLLSNIYFTQRLPEMAMLSAIGYSRRILLGRVVGETALLCVTGWLLGAGMTTGLLSLIRHWYLTPRGLLLNATDVGAYAFTFPLPLAITAFAVVTLSVRLSQLDPVSIIERRA